MGNLQTSKSDPILFRTKAYLLIHSILQFRIFIAFVFWNAQ